MGTEVLRPQDCLVHHRIRVAPVVFPRRRNYGNGQHQGGRPNNNVNNTAGGNRRVQIRPEQRRKSPEQPRPKRSASVGDLKERSVGQVTILRRGESIEWKSDQATSGRNIGGDDGAISLSGNGRLGPDPEMVPKQIRLSLSTAAGDKYAGSAFSMSPSPRALPLPSFFSRKSSPVTTHDDFATKDLRRLLRLE